jgi:hypothetical protein
VNRADDKRASLGSDGLIAANDLQHFVRIDVVLLLIVGGVACDFDVPLGPVQLSAVELIGEQDLGSTYVDLMLAWRRGRNQGGDN